MIDGSEKRNRQLAFELQNSHVCEKRSKVVALALGPVIRCWIRDNTADVHQHNFRAVFT